MLLLLAAAAALHASDLIQQFPKCDPTFPAAAYNKVRKLLQQAEPDGNVVELPDKEYKSLTFEEKFVYAMTNGEVDMQICDPGMDSSPNADMKIVGVWPAGQISDQAGWSDRQEVFLKRNRSQVIQKIRPLIDNPDFEGSFQSAVVLLDAWELIPVLLSRVKRTKQDWSDLTICFILMRDGHYPPFLKSATYRKLYGPNSNSKRFILGNQANIDLTTKRAMDYYHSKLK